MDELLQLIEAAWNNGKVTSENNNWYSVTISKNDADLMPIFTTALKLAREEHPDVRVESESFGCWKVSIRVPQQ